MLPFGKLIFFPESDNPKNCIQQADDGDHGEDGDITGSLKQDCILGKYHQADDHAYGRITK